jgi:hypothetical protein
VVGSFVEALDAFAVALEELEPGCFSPPRCAELVERCSRLGHALDAARLRFAARAAEARAYDASGYADASDWLAATTGSTSVQARAELELARRLDDCPETAAALGTGAVSVAQALEVTRTAAEVPGSELELLELAKRGSLSRVRDAARTIRAAAIRAEELYARQRAAREVRHWRDELGMVCGSFRLTPEIGVAFVNRLDRHAERCRKAARRDGRTERWEAHAADAFAALVAADVCEHPAESATKAKPRSGRADLVLVCDERAYRRGYADADETCHVVGGGPLPVSVARDLAGEAFVKLVLHDGVDILAVKHIGRRRSAELDTALRLGPPLAFEGLVCCEDGCDRRYHLELDHVDPVANGGGTTYENLQPRCWPHHRKKTERDRAAGRLGARSTGRTAKSGRPPPSEPE